MARFVAILNNFGANQDVTSPKSHRFGAYSKPQRLDFELVPLIQPDQRLWPEWG